MSEWVKRWGYELSKKTVRPGIWRAKEGGYMIMVRATSPRTAKRKTFMRLLRDATVQEAQRTRDELKAEARDFVRGRTRKRMRFADYATSLYERKIIKGELKSAKSRERWHDTLKVLIDAFGEFHCEEIRLADIEAWKEATVTKRSPKTKALYAPSTINGWLSILRTISKTMVAELELGRDPAATVRDIDGSTRPTYTDESPNSLTADKAKRFLELMKERYPQHYAMTLLGFVTGLRPSSLRPLRRSGEHADVLWKEGVILVRRSNAMKQEIMATTKTKRHQRIHLPPAMMRVLEEHVWTIENPPIGERGKAPLWWNKKMTRSSLLFPARSGGLRTRSVLDKPFKDVRTIMKLGYRLTPRGMRRTFKDLARAAEMNSVVSKAISGHVTDSMHEHYSTASADEMRRGIGKVVSLVEARKKVGTKVGSNRR